MKEEYETGVSIQRQFRCNPFCYGFGAVKLLSFNEYVFSKVMHNRPRDTCTLPLGSKLGMITDSAQKKQLLQEIPLS